MGERRILQALFLGCSLEMPSSLGFDLSYPPFLAAPLPYICLGKGASVKGSNRAKSEPCHQLGHWWRPLPTLGWRMDEVARVESPKPDRLPSNKTWST